MGEPLVLDRAGLNDGAARRRSKLYRLLSYAILFVETKCVEVCGSSGLLAAGRDFWSRVEHDLRGLDVQRV